MPGRFSSGQRARIRSATRGTYAARVQPNTAAKYHRYVVMFHNFCDAMGYRRRFRHRQITEFAEWYVSEGTGRKLRAHNTVDSILSALADHCVTYGLVFPFAGTRSRRRLNRWLQGLANRYPHVPQPDTPLTMDIAGDVASALGIRSAVDLELARLDTLCVWARIIVAKDGCLRSVEHSQGMQVRDAVDRGSFFELTVGRRKAERKIKHRKRVVTLDVARTHLSAGFVLRVLLRRLHLGARSTDCLFPAVSRAGIPSGTAEPWPDALRRLRRLCRSAGHRGRFGASSLRAGGATDYFAIGASRDWVKAQGGWLSDAYQRYDRPTPRQRAYLGRRYAGRVLHHHGRRPAAR